MKAQYETVKISSLQTGHRILIGNRIAIVERTTQVSANSTQVVCSYCQSFRKSTLVGEFENTKTVQLEVQELPKNVWVTEDIFGRFIKEIK